MTASTWSDLRLRFVSASFLIFVFLVAVWSGVYGILLLTFAGAIAMHWELARMFNLSGRRLFFVCSIAVLGWLPLIVQSKILPSSVFLVTIGGALPIIIGTTLIKKMRAIYIIYGAIMTLGLVSFWYIAMSLGTFGVTILAVLVILSDVGGYIVGRAVGGRKFWPAISPKKTWSGIIAGWVLAALFGYILIQNLGTILLIPIFIVVVIGAQLGDIAESWVKRRTSVKDSSNLIPGHGGVLDRFDGLIGGALVLAITAPLFLN